MSLSVPESDTSVTRGVFVSDDVLHVLTCGTNQAGWQVIIAWKKIIETRDATGTELGFLQPPSNVSCNCGRFVATV